MKKLSLLLSMLVYPLLAAPLSENHPGLIPDQAKAIHIKSSYLKNLDKRVKALKKKIKRLKSKETLNQKALLRLETHQTQLKKIPFWKKYHQLTKKIISTIRKNDKASEATYSKLEGERAQLRQKYRALTKEPFPKDFDQKVYSIRQKIKDIRLSKKK